jgi:hypothetical protein
MRETILQVGDSIVAMNSPKRREGKALFYFVEADLLPTFPFVLEQEDEDGNVTGPIDLSDYSAITLRMRREDGYLIEVAATIDNPTEGECHFEWAAGDLTVGIHRAEVRLTRLSDSKIETIPAQEPMTFEIRGRV